MDKITTIIQQLGGEIQQTDAEYLAATFTSGIFGFVDDLEIRLDTSKQVLQIRSASRVGHSDLGANRKRVENIRALYEI